MSEVTVGEYVLESDELYKQLWPKRVIHRCHHRTTNEQYLIKIWWHDVNCPIDSRPLFNNEIRVLKQLQKSSVRKYLPILVKFEESEMLQRDNNAIPVAYELFQPVKHQSLYYYHNKLPQQLKVHLFRETVEFVRLLNEQHNMSIMYLHPSHILLTEGQLPCFINLMYTRKLHHSDTATDVSVDASFNPPETLEGDRKINFQRADSFQLGVLACHLFCGTVCCETKNSALDSIYSLLMKQRYDDFWKRIRATDKPQPFKAMVQMLLEPEPTIRIDPYVIRNLEWWKCYEPPAGDILAVVDQQEKEKKEKQLLEAKLKSQTRLRPAFLQVRTPVPGSGTRRTVDLDGHFYRSQEYLNCLFFPLRIYELYELLKDRLKGQVSACNEAAYSITVEFHDWTTPFLVKLRLYNHADTDDVAVLQYEFLQGDLLQCEGKYSSFIRELERSREECELK